MTGGPSLTYPQPPPPLLTPATAISSGMNPTILATPPSNSNLGATSTHPRPTPQKHTASGSSTSSHPGSLTASALLRSTRPSTDSGRSSGEYTAVTIYSMYSDVRDETAPTTARHSGSAPSSSRPSSSRGKDLSLSPPRHSAHLSVSSAGKHASSTSWTDYHRPSSQALPSQRSPKLQDDRVRESPEPLLPAAEVAIFPASPIDNGNVDLPVGPFPNSESNALHLLPIPQRLPSSRPGSVSSSPQLSATPSTTNSIRAPSPSVGHLLTETGETEDADSLHVRSTYARLEQSGVPGDGYEEGIERTRARAPSKVDKRTTVFDDKHTDLSQQELELLSTLDRYGFKETPLSTRQENRLALLPIGPLGKGPTPVRTPPSSPPSPPEELKSVPSVHDDPKELSRMEKWERMLKVVKRDEGGNIERWTFDPKKGRKLRERIYKGVPDRWRSAVWWTLIDTSRVEVLCPPNSAASASPRSRMSASNLGRQYRELKERPSSHDIQIDLDVPRTISGHVLFHTRYGSGQRSLFHVLHAFSLLCPDCGYCQGMGPIAATLLCYLDPDRVYTCMVRIHDSYDMHSIFSPGFPGLLESIYVQERLTEQLMPDVYASFKRHMISSTSYATKWYITLFANTFTFQTQLRLWDAFFLEGRDVIVIISLSILWVLREHLASAQANFETILSLLSSFFVAESENALLTWMSKALQDKKLRASMSQWRTDWRELVRTGKDKDALL